VSVLVTSHDDKLGEPRLVDQYARRPAGNKESLDMNVGVGRPDTGLDRVERDPSRIPQLVVRQIGQGRVHRGELVGMNHQ